MRRDPDYFGDGELHLIYVARKLKDALRLEEWLTGLGVEYLVETDTYTVGLVFRAKRVGAFFYVAPSADAAARDALRQGGFKPHEQ